MLLRPSMLARASWAETLFLGAVASDTPHSTIIAPSHRLSEIPVCRSSILPLSPSVLCKQNYLLDRPRSGINAYRQHLDWCSRLFLSNSKLYKHPYCLNSDWYEATSVEVCLKRKPHHQWLMNKLWKTAWPIIVTRYIDGVNYHQTRRAWLLLEFGAGMGIPSWARTMLYESGASNGAKRMVMAHKTWSGVVQRGGTTQGIP